MLFLLLFLTGCGWRTEERPIGYAYTGPKQLTLRGDLGQRAATTAIAEHGERLEILEARRRFVRVRTRSGGMGWVDSTYLLTQSQMDDLTRLSDRAAQMPVQGKGSVVDTLNVHVNANRNAASFTQLDEGDKFDIVAHAISEREVLADGVRRLDDWFLVRTPEGRAGWVLARVVLMEIPDEVAQYAAGHYIVAYQPMGESAEPGKLNWLWATSARMRQPYDFDSLRVFNYNARRGAYSTAYIERNLKGYYPLEKTPTGFSAVIEEQDGQLMKRFYAFNGTRVKLERKEPYTLPPPLPMVGEPESFDKEDPEGGKAWPDRAFAYARWWLGL